jgi:hypothetical protein
VPQAHIVATDVNPGMLALAAQRLGSVTVSFQRADAQDLPLFPDDPPAYMERGPFSYADPALIERDLLAVK